MAKPNYSYEKRQKELAKQRKKQEKLQRKAHKQDDHPTQGDAGGVSTAKDSPAPADVAGTSSGASD